MTRWKSARLRGEQSLNPYPAHYRPAFAFSSVLYRQTYRRPLRLAVSARQRGLPVYHVPYQHHCQWAFRVYAHLAYFCHRHHFFSSSIGPAGSATPPSRGYTCAIARIRQWYRREIRQPMSAKLQYRNHNWIRWRNDRLWRDWHKRFGEKLRTLRQRQGLSQEQLGDMLGVHQTHVGRIERGEKIPNVAMVIKISDISVIFYP